MRVSKKTLTRKNDVLWSKIIRFHGRCEVCGRKDCKLDAHHWCIGRTVRNTRWDLENGLSLCFVCHRLAHDSPPIFIDKLVDLWGKKEYIRKCDNLKKKSQKTKLTLAEYEDINKRLKDILDTISWEGNICPV